MEKANYLKYNANQFKFPRNIFNLNKKKIVDNALSDLASSTKILDAGCGSGLISCHLSKNHKVFGVDGDLGAIKFCKKNYPKNRYYLMDLEKGLKFKSNYFDGIIFVETIEHLVNPDIALKELKRVLKKSGVLVITTPNYDSLKWQIVEKMWYPIFGGECRPESEDVHPSKFTEEKLIEIVKKHFRDFSVDTFNFGMWLSAVCHK